MIWNILQLIFCIILFVLPLALYKSHRSFMVRFYDAMIHSVKARKLYIAAQTAVERKIPNSPTCPLM